jgi:Tfp pilus assembly protein PilO
MRTILAIIMVLAAVGGFILFIVPTYNNIQVVREKNSEYEKVVQNAALLEQRLDDLLKKRTQLSTSQLERLVRMLPTNPDNVKLILEIDALAQAQGVLLQNVRIEQVAQDDRASRAAQTTNPDLGKLQLQFTVSGQYPGYVQFVESLEKNLRLMNVQKSSFIAPDDKSSYQYQTTVETYWIK